MLFSFLKLPDYSETLRVLLYISLYLMQLQIHFINIVLNKLMNIFSIRVFPYFFPLETNSCMGKDFIFSDEESENKSLKIFHKIHKEAS